MTVTAEDMQAKYDDPWEGLADLQNQLDEKDEYINELEAEIQNQSQNIQGAFAKLSAIDDEIEDMEGEEPDSQDQNPRGETEQTPLEEVVSLPEELAEDELTANQERARFLAKDVTDYAQKVPAGLVIDSSIIRKVIKAKEGERPHTQTVARVMEFINDLGKEGTNLVKRRGNKMVSFSKELVRKLERANHTRCDRGRNPAPPKDVITG